MNKKHKVLGGDQLVTEEQYKDALNIINNAIDELNDGWSHGAGFHGCYLAYDVEGEIWVSMGCPYNLLTEIHPFKDEYVVDEVMTWEGIEDALDTITKYKFK